MKKKMLMDLFTFNCLNSRTNILLTLSATKWLHIELFSGHPVYLN